MFETAVVFSSTSLGVLREAKDNSMFVGLSMLAKLISFSTSRLTARNTVFL